MNILALFLLAGFFRGPTVGLVPSTDTCYTYDLTITNEFSHNRIYLRSDARILDTKVHLGYETKWTSGGKLIDLIVFTKLLPFENTHMQKISMEPIWKRMTPKTAYKISIGAMYLTENLHMRSGEYGISGNASYQWEWYKKPEGFLGTAAVLAAKQLFDLSAGLQVGASVGIKGRKDLQIRGNFDIKTTTFFRYGFQMFYELLDGRSNFGLTTGPTWKW